MQDIKLDGISKINGGEYATIQVDGITQINGNLKSLNFFIDGKCKVNGNTITELFDCDGMTEIKGNLNATDIKVDGMLTVSGEYIKTTTLVCDGTIKSKEYIHADILDANGIISAKEVTGNNVKIKSYSGKFMKLFFSPVSRVNIIKAKHIELSGVKSQQITGQDIIIGPCCEIDNIDCSGTLKVDKKSVVNNVTGDYSLT